MFETLTVVQVKFEVNLKEQIDSGNTHSVIRKVEDTKGVIRSRKSKKETQHNGQKKKGQATIYKTLHRKLKIEQKEPF